MITRTSSIWDADHYGYGIYIGSWGNNSELNLFGIKIKDHACGIFSRGDSTNLINLYGCEISNNYPADDVNNTDLFGGGILTYNYTTAHLYSTTVKDNVSKSGGGGMYVYGIVKMYSGSEVKNNRATYSGGGISATAVFLYDGSSVKGNTAGEDGGGIYATAEVELHNATVTGNTANNGGGIYSYGSREVVLSGSTTVTGNTANGKESNIHLHQRPGSSIQPIQVSEGYSGRAGITTDYYVGKDRKLLAVTTEANAAALLKRLYSDNMLYDFEADSDGTKLYLINPSNAAKVTPAGSTEGTNYSDLSAALSAAKNSPGSTLTLLRGKALSGGLTIDSGSFTLDLNGKTLKSADGTATLTISGGSVTVKNGTLQNTGTGEGLLVTGGTLTLGAGADFSSLKLANGQTAANILPEGLAYRYTGTRKSTSDIHLKEIETVTSNFKILSQPSPTTVVGNRNTVNVTLTSGIGDGRDFWNACSNQNEIWYSIDASGNSSQMTISSHVGGLGMRLYTGFLEYNFSNVWENLIGSDCYALVRWNDHYLFSERTRIIDKITPTLSGVTASATYTGSDIPATAITGTATYNGETVPGTWSWKDGNAPKTVADSTTNGNQWYAVFTPTDGTTYYSKDAEVTVTIAPKPVTATVTVTDKTYDTTNTATVSAAVTTEEGLAAGDTITITGLTGTFDNVNAGTGKTVTVNASNVSISGDDKDNYSVTIPATAQGTILKADQTAPGAPTVKADATTSAKVELEPITTTGFGAVQYAASTTTAAPTDESAWQASAVFTGLTKNTQYYFFARYAGDTNHNPSPASTGTSNQTLDTYTITYDLNGGSGTTPTAQTQDVGTGFTTAVKDGFDRTGYSFLGWAATESAATASYAAGAAVSGMTANTTLYAVWQPITYNIDYALNGGTVSTANPGTYTVETASFTLNNPTRIGYTFAGWTDGSGSDAQLTVTVAMGSVDNRTYTATWTAKQYNITYMGMENATHGEKHPETHTYDTATVISNPTKTGYTFNGWKVGGAETPVKDLTLGATDYTAAITLTANWTINQYTITFDTDGGSEIAPITKNYNASVTAPAAPKKTGHTFASWDPDIPAKMPAENMTVKATWTPDVYTVTLNTNKGKIQEGDVTEYTYGVGAKLPTKVTRPGYRFAGWYDNEDCKGKPVTEITTTDIDDKIFYAAWTYIPPTYPPTVEQPDEGGAVTVLPKNPEKGDTVTITPKPEDGYVVDEVTVTDKDGKPVEVTDNGDGSYSFTQPSGKVTVTVTFTDKTEFSFVDVPANAYYYDAVLWAAKNGITGGVDDTHFAPNATCTRAQVVTFLWRAAGSPAPKNSMMPFTDVPAGSYYETAVLWAVENGITKGTSATTFSPNATCSRGQIVSFLWRALGSPAVSGSAVFTDLPAGSYYETAVLWAVENGITNGTGNGMFSPNADCTRAQIVTFLWRALAE